MVELLFFVPLLVVLGLKVSLGRPEHGKAQPAFWAGAKLRAVPMKKGNPVPQQPRSPTFWLLSAFSSVFLSLCAVWLTTLISVMFNLTPKLALNKTTFHKMPRKKTRVTSDAPNRLLRPWRHLQAPAVRAARCEHGTGPLAFCSDIKLCPCLWLALGLAAVCCLL